MPLGTAVVDVKRAYEEAKKPHPLSKFIDPFLDILIPLVFMLALLKDLADITIGLIPAVGDFLSLLLSVFCSILIFLVMTLLGGRNFSFVVKRLLIILAGLLLDSFPLIKYLPIETTVVLINYLLILKERKGDYKEHRQKEAIKQQAIQQTYVAAEQSN